MLLLSEKVRPYLYMIKLNKKAAIKLTHVS
jgi:hypothetical protein